MFFSPFLLALSIPFSFVLEVDEAETGDPKVYDLGTVVNNTNVSTLLNGYWGDSRPHKVWGDPQASPPSWASDLTTIQDDGDSTCSKTWINGDGVWLDPYEVITIESHYTRSWHHQKWRDGIPGGKPAPVYAERSKNFNSSGIITFRVGT